MLDKKFFKYCSKCRRYFLSEEDWNSHLKQHNPNYVPAPIVREQPTVVTQESQHRVVGENLEDAWLERTRKLRAVKNKLYELGYECQTLNEQDTMELYQKAKAEGKI